MSETKSDEIVNHFVGLPRDQFQTLLVLKVESGSRTWLEFYEKLKKAKDQNLISIDWDKIDHKKKKG